MDQIELCAVEMLKKPILDIAVAEIAKMANVSQVTIYNYYGSKEALLVAAMKRLFNQSLNEFKRMLDSELTFDEKLKRMILMKRESSSHVHPDTYVRLLAENKEMQAYMQSYSKEHSIPLFLEFIREGRACGRVRSHVHDETVLVYLNMFSHAVSLVTEKELSQMGQPGGIEEFIDLFFYGMLNQQENG
jgi:AcrR family transcriptional regulator